MRDLLVRGPVSRARRGILWTFVSERVRAGPVPGRRFDAS